MTSELITVLEFTSVIAVFCAVYGFFFQWLIVGH